MTVNTIIDLSHWKPISNPAALIRDGVVGVIHKATNGMDGVDTQWVVARDMCTAAKVLFGTFHFGTGENPVLQVDHYLRTIGDNPGLRCLDLEPNPLGTDMTIQVAEAWVSEFYRRMKFYPVIYTGEYYVKNVFESSILAKCDLWITGYEGKPIMPQAWKTWKFWQYTNGTAGPMAVTTPGVGDGHIDRNQFNGTLEELQAYWYPKSEPVPIPTLKPADSFQPPVGPDSYLTNGNWLPQPTTVPHKWYSANNWGNRYLLGSTWAIHTGADLNLAGDEDRDQNILASANGTIIFADAIPNSSWGNVIIEECTKPDGSKIWFRYAHSDAMYVVAGQVVNKGDVIGLVGNAFKRFAYHLHYDATLKDILTGGVRGAADWPGDDLESVKADYIDPHTLFLPVVAPPVPVPPPPVGDSVTVSVTAPLGIHLRAHPGTAASTVAILPKGTKIILTNAGVGSLANGYIWYQVKVLFSGQTGWAAIGPINGSEVWWH